MKATPRKGGIQVTSNPSNSGPVSEVHGVSRNKEGFKTFHLWGGNGQPGAIVVVMFWGLLDNPDQQLTRELCVVFVMWSLTLGGSIFSTDEKF